jgi:hypothetical protein
MSSSEDANSLSAPGHKARSPSVQAFIDVVKAAKQREKSVTTKYEEMAIAEERKNDPLFNALGKELKNAKGEKIEKAQHAKMNATQSELVKAAQAKQDERAKLADEQQIVATRKQDAEFKKLGNELGKIVAEKEFKHNNEVAWEQIQARQKSSSLSALNTDLVAGNHKLRAVVKDSSDAAAEMNRKLAAGKGSSSSSGDASASS